MGHDDDAVQQSLSARIDAALAARPAAPESTEALLADLDVRIAQVRALSQDLGLSAETAFRQLPGGRFSLGALKRPLHALVVFYTNGLAARLEAAQHQQIAALETLREIVVRQQRALAALRAARGPGDDRPA